MRKSVTKDAEGISLRYNLAGKRRLQVRDVDAIRCLEPVRLKKLRNVVPPGEGATARSAGGGFLDGSCRSLPHLSVLASSKALACPHLHFTDSCSTMRLK